MAEWQPIETAPEGEFPPTILITDGKEVCSAFLAGFWHGLPQWEQNAQLCNGDGSRVDFTPTHWMPLPEPPKQA